MISVLRWLAILSTWVLLSFLCHLIVEDSWELPWRASVIWAFIPAMLVYLGTFPKNTLQDK